MATNAQQLTKGWIQFLKNNQIVDLKSDPNTGKLSYKRKVTSDDVSRFLEVKTDFTEEQISNAIHMVLAKNAVNRAGPKLPNTPKGPSTDVATQDIRPGSQQKTLNAPPKPRPVPPKSKYSKDGAEDVEYRDSVNEEIADTTGYELGEDDVEQIFNILAGGQASQPAGKTAQAPKAEVSPEQDLAEKEEKIRKIKRLVRDTMTDTQRKALWRALTNA